jgi:hypothetical protein
VIPENSARTAAINERSSQKTKSAVQKIYELPPTEQAERFRALFEYLDRQHMDLVSNYHLMVIPWTRQPVIDRFNKTARGPGFKLVRASLLDTCILAITRLLLDGDDSNPSLCTMMRPFLRRNREKRAELLQILEQDYSDWHRRISPEERRNEPEWAIKMFEEQDEKDAQACRKEFRERADAVAEDWPQLKKASAIFAPVRNKWLAHLELEYDAGTKESTTVQLPSIPEVYVGIQAVVPTITKSVSHLARLFKKNLSITPPEQSVSLAKQRAAAFWEIQ